MPLLEARLDEMDGNSTRALDHYLKAIELGELRPTLVYQVSRLLADRGRFQDADRAIRRLQQQVTLGRDFARDAADIALRAGNPERALTLARQVVPPATPDYRDHLWLGEMLAGTGRRQEAEQTLRRALEIGGKTLGAQHPFLAESQNALAAVLLHQMRPADAEPLLEQALKSYEVALEISKELRQHLESIRSATLMNEKVKKGTEADDCFYIQHASQVIGKDIDLDIDPPPDLAIEVDITSPSLKKFPIYAALGVPELWRYKRGQTIFYQLVDNEYEETSHSLAFPFLTPDVITEYLQDGLEQGQVPALLAFADWVRANKPTA